MAMVKSVGFVLLAGTLLGGASVPNVDAVASREVVLWAWARPEDLRFLDDNPGVGVAFLTETLTLDGAEIHASPRRQPLLVPETTPLEAVVRIEWVRGRAMVDTPELRRDIVRHFEAAAALPRVEGVQVDFDAPVSARPFYGALLQEIHAALPPGTRFSMTALASWCTSDIGWLESVAPSVDEVIPMVFSMGRDAPRVWGALDLVGGFTSPACSGAVGVAVGERVPRVGPGARAYIFDRRAWTRADFDATMRRLGGYVTRGERGGGP